MTAGAWFRLARAEDAEGIARLYRQLLAGTQPDVRPAQIEALAHDPGTRLVVGELQGALVATALLCVCRDVMFGQQPFGVIENVVVDEACRGNGIGAALMRSVERYALAADCSKLMLLSAASRQSAHRFFARCGYEGDLKRGFVRYRRAFSLAADLA